jgi:hypothetical protein
MLTSQIEGFHEMKKREIIFKTVKFIKNLNWLLLICLLLRFVYNFQFDSQLLGFFSNYCFEIFVDSQGVQEIPLPRLPVQQCFSLFPCSSSSRKTS